MGWKSVVLLVVGLVSYVKADCECYEAGNYTGRSAPISNSYESSDFSACYKYCSYVAYSGNDTYGWTALTLNWGTTTNSGGSVRIFDGLDTSGTPLIQVNEGENVLSGSAKSLIKSSSPKITIVYSQTGTGANVYYGVIKAVPGLQPSAAPITTTAVPTTRSYNSPIYKKDPHFITHDILFVVNKRTNGGADALANINALAINFVSLLSTTTDVNSDSGSRLALATLTPYDPYYSVQGGIWELSADDVMRSLTTNGISIEGNIDEALKGLVNLAFTVNKNESTDSRKNAQRSIILFTAEWPSNANLSVTDVKTVFDQKGVNLLVVGYNLSSTESTALLRTDDRWYNAINTLYSNATSVASFVNPFYFNDGSQTNYWCPQFPIILLPGNTTLFFQEPYNYDGPYSTAQPWPDPFDGQTARYCNFANNQYTFSRPNGTVGMTVQVFYEIEAASDFLNFYDDSNNLIASFTGYEILSSSFYTTTSTLTATFTSNNKSVFRGFYVSITPKSA